MIYVIKNWSEWGTEILFSLVLSSVKIFLLAAFVLFLLKFLRSKNPATQHLAWIIVLGGMIVIPVASFIVTPPVSLAVVVRDISKPTNFNEQEFSINNDPQFEQT